MIKRFFIIVCLMFFITSCSSWVKPPGVSEEQFSRDLSYCNQRALSLYPIDQEPIENSYTTHSTTTCYKYGHSIECTTTHSSSGPRYTDVNKQDRENAKKDCMFKKGYRLE
jgi:PBP1b-binding outer membrane lipoprotein LpoB